MCDLFNNNMTSLSPSCVKLGIPQQLRIPLIEHLMSSTDKRTLLNQIQAPLSLSQPSTESWMISETKHSPNHALSHSSCPSLISTSTKSSQIRMQHSPNISTQLSPLNGSLLKQLNVGYTTQEGLEDKNVPYHQNPC